MTAKEKAHELVDKMHEWFIEYGQAKGCALIAVEECLHTCVESMLYYWNEVKEEIEKL